MKALDPLAEFDAWLAALKVEKANDGPARGTVAGALVVLERLKLSPSLNLADHLAPKGTQIKGASGKNIANILAGLGEHRAYLSEGGRTNRGLLNDIQNLLVTLKSVELAELPNLERRQLINAMQQRLLVKVHAYLNRQRIPLVCEPGTTSLATIIAFLEKAAAAGKEGAVAQHLVGAKLQRRYPDLTIENYNTTTADTQLARHGDFVVNDTVFHVTVAPMPPVFDKCRANLANGLLVYLLVPQRLLLAAQQMAGDAWRPRIMIKSLEDFVAQNVDEIGSFTRAAHSKEIRLLFELYNLRVDAAESDKSLLAEIPLNLTR